MRISVLLFSLLSLQGMAQFGPAVEVQNGLDVNSNPINGGSSSSFRIEDVDGDGALDVVHILSPITIVWIRNGDGMGTFILQDPIWMSASDQILYDLADIDLDGDLDVVVYERNGDQHALIRIENMGNGSFGPPVQISDGAEMDLPVTAYDIALGQLICSDLSGDGFPEVLYTVRGGVRWFLNNGNGTFGPVQSFNRGQVSSYLSVVLRVDDIDGDGDQDIVTDTDMDPGLSGEELYVALNEGLDSLTFEPFTLHSPYTNYFENITVVDIDEDGDLDVLDVGWSVKWYENPLAQSGLGAFEYHWIEQGENEGSSSIGKIGCNNNYTLVYGRWPWEFYDYNLRWTHFYDQIGDFTPPAFNETPKARYYRLADINSDGHLDMVTYMNDTTRWYPYDPDYLTSLLELELPFDTLTLNDGPQPLIGGSPEGGIYSLAGSTDTITVFDPIEAGLGEHQVVYSYTDPFTGCSGTDTATVIVELSTGITRNDHDIGIEVFPNPANDHCTFSFSGGPSDLQLIDATGRVVRQWSAVSSPFQADLSPYHPGIYLIRSAQGVQQNKVKLVLQ